MTQTETKVRKRDASPAATAATAAAKDAQDAQDKGKETKAPTCTPPRPSGLRGSIMQLYGALAVTVLAFALLGESMLGSVPEGKFQLKDGSLIDVEKFDPVELGPYPKCHPHHEEHEAVAEDGSKTWVKNLDAPKGGPYPAGHPDNPEWLVKSDAKNKADNAESRFKWKGLQPNLHLLSLATLCVLIGSKHSVWLFTETYEAGQSSGGQVLQSDDAYMFPILGSAALLGLFLLLKYVGTFWIKTMLTCWIVFICTCGLGKNTEEIVAVFRSKTTKPLFKIPVFDEEVRLIELFGCAVGACMAAYYVYTKNWIINNVFGLSFCCLGIRIIGLSNIKVGVIMLCGLFFYDVFWVFGSKSVFGSNVMVSVATGIEAPIKLMFPRDMGGCGVLRHSMLGLGDIVVPGIFIAFLAKFDAVRMGEKACSSFVYLNSVMVAYVLSLVTTVSIMLFFNAAQPALLYIVPYVLITTAIVAVSRGEVKELWEFEISDGDENTAEATGAKEGDKKTD